LPLFIVAAVLVLTDPAKIAKLGDKIGNSTRPNSENREAVEVIAQNLDTPWAIAFIDRYKFLVTERKGRVSLVEDNKLTPVADISQVLEIGEGGLLGIAIHPQFASNNFVYFYYTYNSSTLGTLNRVVRMEYKDGKLGNERTIVDAIPGASNHNGGRIKFGPDNYLYITTGDAQEPSQSQDRNSLAGKILRVTDDGRTPSDNPFGNPAYSLGHRNGQGIAWDGNTLWETEHGRSGFPSGLDEVNKIVAGRNYGWPTIQGNEMRSGMESPITNSGNDTWAPAGAAIFEGRLYFGGLRGEALYEMNLVAKSVKEHFKGEYGRIREVILSPDNFLYITTSNQDGRGTPSDSDDKIIRIDPRQLAK